MTGELRIDVNPLSSRPAIPATARPRLLVAADFEREPDDDLRERLRVHGGSAHVFQFDDPRAWYEVVLHLDNPHFLAALDEDMERHVGERWDHTKGPWSFGRCGSAYGQASEDLFAAGWDYPSLEAWSGDLDDFEPTQEDLEAEFEAMLPFLPQPGTIAWYRAWGCCHWLAPAFAALGRLLFPELTWRVVRGEAHSVAWGFSEADPGGVLMDPLMTGGESPATAGEIVEFALRTWEEHERRAQLAAENDDRDVLGLEELRPLPGVTPLESPA